MLKLLFLVVVVVGIGSAVFFWQLGRTTSTTEVPAIGEGGTTTPDVATTTTPIAGRGSLVELQGLGKNLECTITRRATEAESELTGTTFLSAGNIRGDFVGSEGNASTVSSMIVSGGTLYVWSEVAGATYGVEVNLAAPSEAAATSTLDAREPVALNEPVHYDCKPWAVVDKSIFTPPGDVLFRDLREVMEQGMEYGTVFPE